MATKTIAWETGSGYITLTYTGIGNSSISVESDTNDSFEDRQQSVQITTTNGSPQKAVSLLIKQKGKTYPVGTVFNYDYTGSVQQVTLPKGKYKLQCWGAQGGSVSGSYSATGSKGGYSEGVLTLTKATTLYIFVGGKGTDSSTSSTSGTANGGWNGGGASVRKSSYSSGDTYGESYPRPGGGATDMCLVTSSMSYSSGRTNRSSASLLSRFIVAGGGAGASARYTEETTETTSESQVSSGSLSKDTSSIITIVDEDYIPTKVTYRPLIGTTLKAGVTYTVQLSYTVETGTFAYLAANNTNSGDPADNLTGNIYGAKGSRTIEYTPSIDVKYWYMPMANGFVYSENTVISVSVQVDEEEHLGEYSYSKSIGSLSQSTKYRISLSGSSYNSFEVEYYNSSGNKVGSFSSTEFTTPSTYYPTWKVVVKGSSKSNSYSYKLYKSVTVTNTNESSGQSNASQQGGGTSGRGQYPGTQNSAGSGGDFGLGANQTTTNYLYDAGAGGGGWYGGGTSQSDSSTNYVNYSGGGSGFVNTQANSNYRPSNYTGLELDSGSTKDGSTSFPAPSGGNETGHSGNGYARITVL